MVFLAFIALLVAAVAILWCGVQHEDDDAHEAGAVDAAAEAREGDFSHRSGTAALLVNEAPMGLTAPPVVEPTPPTPHTPVGGTA